MQEEDHFESENAPFVGAVKAGWLSKMGEGLMGSWHKHWFVLADSCLYYFSGPSETEGTPRCTIPIEDLKIGRGLNRRDIMLVPLLGDVIRTTKFKVSPSGLPSPGAPRPDRDGLLLIRSRRIGEQELRWPPPPVSVARKGRARPRGVGEGAPAAEQNDVAEGPRGAEPSVQGPPANAREGRMGAKAR
eukprot:scaffold462_cov195-Pinguiococcus_pyrenoidosus.AAC.90